MDQPSPADYINWLISIVYWRQQPTDLQIRTTESDSKNFIRQSLLDECRRLPRCPTNWWAFFNLNLLSRPEGDVTSFMVRNFFCSLLSHCAYTGCSVVQWLRRQTSYLATRSSILGASTGQPSRSLTIANVNACGCKMACMWLTQPETRLPHDGFLQLCVVWEVDQSMLRR